MATQAQAEIFESAPNSENAPNWRSALYPTDWKPGFSDAQGRFLHDFSYAGYQRGEKPIPQKTGPILDVTLSPYFADATGERDSTAAIQSALDAAAATAGGGVVYLPPGLFRIAPPEDLKTALRIKGSQVVLRGAGADKTFLWNSATVMREKTVILVEAESPSEWRDEGPGAIITKITKNVPSQALEIPVEDPSVFSVGDQVILRSDLTQRFIDEVEMTGKWQPAGATSPNRTLMFSREIVRLTPTAIVIDTPLRYPLNTEDLARVVKRRGTILTESGLESFSFGNTQHPGTGLGEEDYKVPGTVGNDVDGSRFILFRNARNCWVND